MLEDVLSTSTMILLIILINIYTQLYSLASAASWALLAYILSFVCDNIEKFKKIYLHQQVNSFNFVWAFLSVRDNVLLYNPGLACLALHVASAGHEFATTFLSSEIVGTHHQAQQLLCFWINMLYCWSSILT